MAPDPETAFELADLNRKLTTARALLSYEQKCAETRLLEASEEQRQLRVKLIHLEPEYESLQHDLAEHERYIEEVDTVLAATTERLGWSEGRVARYKERIKELEEKLQTRLISEGSERGVLVAELEDMRSRCHKLEEKAKRLEKELENEYQKGLDLGPRLAAQYEEFVTAQKEVATLKKENEGLKGENEGLKEKNTELQEEASSLQDGGKALKEEITALKTRLQDHVNRLQKAITTKQSLEAEHRAEKELLEKELSVLRAELEDSQTSATRKAEDSLKSVKKEAAAERAALEKELSALRLELSDSQKTVSRLQSSKPTTSDSTELKTALKNETIRREELEKEIALLTKDWGYKQTVFEDALEKNRIKIAKLTSLNTALKTAPKTAPPPAENPKKRPLPAITPFDDLDASVKRPRQERPLTSDFSLTPFFTKHAIVTTDSPLTPSAVIAHDTTSVADETSIIDRSMRAERSIIVPAAIESSEPTRLLLAGANRKRKPKTKPSPPAAIIEESPEPEPVKEKEKEKAKPKSRGKKLENIPPESPHIFDSPSSENVSKPVPIKKRKRPVVAPAVRRNPFREDDGTGRLVVATGESGERGALATGLVGRPTVFSGEISPAKKRPEVLKKWFPGGKK